MLDEMELCKLKAEDYQKNFDALRTVEWHVTTEMFAGYAAIALAFTALREHGASMGPVALGAIVVTVILYVTTLYLSLRIQERLHVTRDDANAYFDKLHQLLRFRPLELPSDAVWPPSAESETSPAPAKRKPRFWFREHMPPLHKKWYAFAGQQIISVAWMAGLIFYIISVLRDP